MKRETNNEMDLLLRRLGRRQDASAPHGDHLDADELSSYAENALPAAARARYTEHLAECSSCRKLVAQLSSSLGVVAAAETAKISQPSALRKFLASLFSPMVLRYAVPALGLIVVAVIGLTVVRRNEPGASVVQLTDQERSKTGVASTEPAESPSSSFLQDSAEKATSPTAKAPARAAGTEQAIPAPPPNAPPAVSVTTDVQRNAPATKAEAQPSATPAAQPAAKLATASDETQRRNEAEARKQSEVIPVTPGNQVQKERAEEPAKRDDRRAEEAAPAPARARPLRGKTQTSDSVGAQSGGSIGTFQRDGLEKKDKDASAETRYVAGRRFRKQRGIWIDTAYESSTSTTNLSRGSEQYRALVADEPAIKQIADQLDGEIIVVWKGRVYRIR